MVHESMPGDREIFEPQKLIDSIEKEGRGNYGIRQKDMKKLDGLLIEEVHPKMEYSL
jgi:hypothetical protein